MTRPGHFASHFITGATLTMSFGKNVPENMQIAYFWYSIHVLFLRHFFSRVKICLFFIISFWWKTESIVKVTCSTLFKQSHVFHMVFMHIGECLYMLATYTPVTFIIGYEYSKMYLSDWPSPQWGKIPKSKIRYMDLVFQEIHTERHWYAPNIDLLIIRMSLSINFRQFQFFHDIKCLRG